MGSEAIFAKHFSHLRTSIQSLYLLEGVSLYRIHFLAKGFIELDLSIKQLEVGEKRMSEFCFFELSFYLSDAILVSSSLFLQLEVVRCSQAHLLCCFVDLSFVIVGLKALLQFLDEWGCWVFV